GESARWRTRGVGGGGWFRRAGVEERGARGSVRREGAWRHSEPIAADGLSAADIDSRIAERVANVSGGVRDRIVRLRVLDVPRHVARELDHAAIRTLKAEALPFHLDVRRPESERTLGVGSPGRRQTLPELVATYLARWPLP